MSGETGLVGTWWIGTGHGDGVLRCQTEQGSAVSDTYVVERTETVNAPAEEVFAKIADLREWGAWSPWDAMDPEMVKTFSDDQGTVGSHYHWKGNRKVGEGSMTVTGIDEPKRVGVDLAFLKPFKSQSKVELVLEPSGESTKVTWRMTGEHTRMTKVMGIFRSMDKMVGPDFEKGLASLKRVSES